MTWIRDNILKITVILVVFIVAIILVSVFSKKNGNKEEKATGYAELENRLQSAAIEYAKDNKSILPSNIDEKTTVKLEKLIKGKYIGDLKAVDDRSISCNGQVIIERMSTDEVDYKFYPHISCGKYYTTKTLVEKILENEEIVTKDDGLYKIGETLIYKGEYPRNYIKLDNNVYRILSIDSDNVLKLISTKRTKGRYVWDDRYNAETNKNYGINNFMKSRLKDTLEFLYYNIDTKSNEVIFTEKERGYFIYHDFCIGKRSDYDLVLNSGADCKETYNTRLGLINFNDYYNASTDPNCIKTGKYDCNNYNYLYGFDYNTFVTLTDTAEDTHTYFLISDGLVTLQKAYRKNILYPVVYISDENVYVSGTGTYSDPYIIR